MIITSVSYLIFIAVSLLIYWHIPHRLQWIVLLIDSLLFYFLNAKAYTFLYLLLSVITVYAATRYFDYENNAKKRKKVLIITLVVNVGVLAALKYTNLLINSVNFFSERISGIVIPNVSWIASLGISFYTLQIIAYLLDCYWGVAEAENNPLKLLLFTSYFPLMVSGPISRYQDLGPKLLEEHRFDYEMVTCGVRRIAWGIAKKVVVADRLSIVVSYMFNNTGMFSGIWVLIAAMLFITQLYFDFSGCMDIVIGVSRCFGIKLMENFRAPFLSKNIQEFWQRWHIALGTWLKNYIMYPLLKTEGLVNLGAKCKKRFGKQGKKIPSYIAMFVVWSLMGLWHGSSWKYVVGEGWWFWLAIVAGQMLEPIFKRLKKCLKINEQNIIWKMFQISRTLVIYAFGMIFFNANSMSSAVEMIGKMFVPTGIVAPLIYLYKGVWSQFGGELVLFLIIVLVGLQMLCDIRVYREMDVQILITQRNAGVRWTLYFLLVFTIIVAGAFGQSSFIYFAF